MPTYPTVSALIRAYGVKSSQRCTCCGGRSPYLIGEWLACALCDTIPEDRPF